MDTNNFTVLKMKLNRYKILIQINDELNYIKIGRIKPQKQPGQFFQQQEHWFVKFGAGLCFMLGTIILYLVFTERLSWHVEIYLLTVLFLYGYGVIIHINYKIKITKKKKITVSRSAIKLSKYGKNDRHFYPENSSLESCIIRHFCHYHGQISLFYAAEKIETIVSLKSRNKKTLETDLSYIEKCLNALFKQ